MENKSKIIVPGETLAQFVQRVRAENNWTTRDVEKQSGNEISNSYITMIETGTALNPSPKMLKALAKGLRLSADAFNGVVFGSSSSLTENEQTLLNHYRQMDDRAKADTLNLTRTLRDIRPAKEADFDIASNQFSKVSDDNSPAPTKRVRKTPTKPRSINE